jgi:hypothetical protein
MSVLLEQYTEKSIAVFGDTEKYKESLKTLGGKYNSNLRGRPGWIFPNSAKSRLDEFVKSIESGGELVVKPRVAASSTPSASNDIIETLLKRIEALEMKVFGGVATPVVAPPVRKASAPSACPEEDCDTAPKRLLRKN